jgi:nucleotide-binding universal stress UspA family protein
MFETIVWATDGSEAADLALPYATSMAAGHRLIAIHSRQVFHGRAAGHPVLADEDELEAKIRDQVATLRDDGVDAILQVVGDVPGAADAIASAARIAGADVIVVGTRGHGAVAGLLLGNVTQQLLHVAPCPVLAVPVGAADHAAKPRRARSGTAV